MFIWPMISPYDKGFGGASTDFFEKLNRMWYRWMLRSNDLYSPLDSIQTRLLDLYSSPSSVSIVSVRDVARARTDDDPGETEFASVHVDLDGMVTAICLGVSGRINSIN